MTATINRRCTALVEGANPNWPEHFDLSPGTAVTVDEISGTMAVIKNSDGVLAIVDRDALNLHEEPRNLEHIKHRLQ